MLVLRCVIAINYVSVMTSAIPGLNFFHEKVICKFKECCNDEYIPYDLDRLEELLEQRLFGQPLVSEVLHILNAHKEAVSSSSVPNSKALALSFHGWSGVGKNHVANIIAEAVYKQGITSNFVKIFMGEKGFDCSSDLEKSKNDLSLKISELVKKCPRSMIIFDEIHHMCASVLDTIKPMLDHHHSVDNVDYRNTIFIFISNIGGNEIANNLLELYSQGVKRNDVEFNNFEPIIRRTAYSTGGFENSSVIANHLIDHYIPFLPMEQQHVEMCVLAEFKKHGVNNPTEEMMMDALSVVTYGPTKDQPIFSNNGCKRFDKQIPYILKKHKRKKEL